MRERIGWGAALAVLCAAAAAPLAAQEFDRYFADKTMRVDYYHTGGRSSELVSLDRVVSDGAWAGSHTQLIDDTNLGKYLFEVVDAASGAVIYSRGYATLYGEWETTGEARERFRTFHESVRFPWPKGPVRVVLKKRGPEDAWIEIATLDVDPDSHFANPADLESRGTVWPLFENGPPSEKVDLVVLGVGYTTEELAKFHADAERLIGELFSYEPFKSRKTDFNVRAIDLPSAVSGVTRPHSDRYRRTPLSTQYGIFDSERYLLVPDNRTMRDVLSAAPYEFVAVLVNEAQYGGGGIFGWQATAAVDSEFSDYVFVHEFGHHFAGLADEYYTSDVAYETGGEARPEPWEPNVTAMHDTATLKWKDLVRPGTPLPTPWVKRQFEEHSRAIRARRAQLIDEQAPEAEFDALFREQRAVEREMLAHSPNAGVVGAFEGAMYEATGLYRSEVDCIMFTRNMLGFCRVCRRALEHIIDLYTS